MSKKGRWNCHCRRCSTCLAEISRRQMESRRRQQSGVAPPSSYPREIANALVEAGGNLARAARALGMTKDGLERRLREENRRAI